MSQTYDCFISYPSCDRVLAESVHARLVAAGFSVWFDKERLKPGFDWHREIETASETSRVIVPLLTPDWKKSVWTRFETYGSDSVVPVVCRGGWKEVKTGPLSGRHALTLDVETAGKAQWQQLFEAIRERLQQPQEEKAKRIEHLRYRPNPYFVGREGELLEICEGLHDGQTPELTQGRIRVLAALGGVGKTTLASEYTHKFWRLYRQIFWVDARHGMEAEFARLFDIMFPEKMDATRDTREKAAAALVALSERTERLLVIDNVEDEKSATPWLPKSGGCHTLLTSRFTDWSAGIQAIHLYILDPDPARKFLAARTQRSPEGDERAACDRLAEKLGYLPLALEIAAAYIHQQGSNFGFADYLRLYEGATRELLSQQRLGSTDYPDSVIATWKATSDALPPEGAVLLVLCSFMAPTPVPLGLFIVCAPAVRALAVDGETSAPIETGEEAELRMRAAASALKAYSLAQFDGKHLQFHTLVQTVERLSHTDAERTMIAFYVVTLLRQIYPSPQFENWKFCAELTPHVWAVEKYAADDAGEDFAQLLNEAGLYLNGRGLYAQAEKLLRRAVRVGEAIGEDDVGLGTTLGNLALTLREMNRLDEAESQLRRSLAIKEAVYGRDAVETAGSLGGLADALLASGRPQEAEELFGRALAICQAQCKANDPLLGTALNNMAFYLHHTGRLEEAKPLYRDALAVKRATLPPDNPEIGDTLQNIANLRLQAGRYDEAEPVAREAVAAREASLGRNHPRTAMSMLDLALLYDKTGRSAESLPLFEHGLRIYFNTYALDHPVFAEARERYVAALLSAGKADEAENFLKVTVVRLADAFGAESLQVARTLDQLTAVLRHEKKYGELLEATLQTGAIYEKIQGPEHPDVGRTLHNLMCLLAEAGLIDDAVAAGERAAAVLVKALGKRDPMAAECVQTLALIKRRQRGQKIGPVGAAISAAWKALRG